MQKNTIFKPISGLLTAFFTFGLFSTALAASATDLKDVSKTDPLMGIYLDLINHQAISLNKDGNFRPTEPINKAAFVKAALAYQGYKPGASLNYFTGYSDVPEESWFAPYVKKALEMRVLTNDLGDLFNPNQSLTRQEALVLTMDFYGFPTPLVSPTSKDLYNDIRTTHPLASTYASAKAHSLYFENGQEYFYPNKILTRGDAADLLFKAKLVQAIINSPEFGSGSISVVPPSYPSSGSGASSDLLNNEKFDILVDTWSKINSQYIYTNNFTEDKLLYGAISGMVDSLNDPYSTFKAPDSDGDSYIYIPENYEGIGAIIEEIDGKYIVQTTITNSPAYRAGLKSKDVILEINGKSLDGLSYDQVTALIKGTAGTTVKLKVQRGTSLLNFEIVREKITIEAIQYKALSGGINYLRIDQFTENSYREFNNHLETIKATGSKKLIIDLRNNPGGYLSSTQQILGHFLDNGQIEFYTSDKDKHLTAYISEGSAELKDYQTVVLINEGSASASEIFAGAVQDYDLAHLIGTTSFGKGSVQEITNYSDNSSLKLTIAKWLTPLKRDIDHIGIVPDLKATITDEQRQKGIDPQLDAAINHLK